MIYTFRKDLRRLAEPAYLVGVIRFPGKGTPNPSPKVGALRVGSLSVSRIHGRMEKKPEKSEKASEETLEYKEFWEKYPELVDTIITTPRLLTYEELNALKVMLPLEISGDQLTPKAVAEVEVKTEVMTEEKPGPSKDVMGEHGSAAVPAVAGPPSQLPAIHMVQPERQCFNVKMVNGKLPGRVTPPSPYQYQVPMNHPRIFGDQPPRRFQPPMNTEPAWQRARLGSEVGNFPRRHFFLPGNLAGNRVNGQVIRGPTNHASLHTVGLGQTVSPIPVNSRFQRDNPVQVSQVTEWTAECTLDTIPEEANGNNNNS